MKKNMYTRVCAKIDLDAILYNMASMHDAIGHDTKIMAVVKTDGYGHGATEIAKTIEPLDYTFGFAVATVEEGVILRNHGITKPILVLGYVFPDEYEVLLLNQLRPAVFTLEMAEELSKEAGRLGVECPVHLKIDTGMNRIGMKVTEESAELVERIAKLPHMILEGIFTHFARADEKDKTAAYEQLRLFQQMIAMLEERGITIPYHHCSNSAGIVEMKEANMDIVRAGITLYGLWPSDEVDKSKISLKPVLSLKSHVAYVKTLEPGESISYGGTYVTTGTEKIATIPVGYGDGYSRGLSNQGYVLIHGKKAPIRGRVCMDQFMVDVTDISDVKIGDEVTLIGKDGAEEITMEEIGAVSGRFNYEFACDLGKRIPRVFYRNDEVVSTRDYFKE